MRALLEQLVTTGLKHLGGALDIDLGTVDPQIERTRDSRHGDFTTNVALRLAKSVQHPPRDFAAQLIEALPSSEQVAKISVAGPGFINFTLSPAAFNRELENILTAGARYGCSD